VRSRPRRTARMRRRAGANRTWAGGYPGDVSGSFIADGAGQPLRVNCAQGARLCRQMLDGRDAAQAIGEALQQCQAVVADGGVVDVDHHRIEERVDLRAQAG